MAHTEQSIDMVVDATAEGLAEVLMQVVDGSPVHHTEQFAALFIAVLRLVDKHPCCSLGALKVCEETAKGLHVLANRALH